MEVCWDAHPANFVVACCSNMQIGAQDPFNACLPHGDCWLGCQYLAGSGGIVPLESWLHWQIVNAKVGPLWLLFTLYLCVSTWSRTLKRSAYSIQMYTVFTTSKAVPV